jgi:hypothetical protein
MKQSKPPKTPSLNAPAFLDTGDIENPFLVIQDVVSGDHLYNIRQNLWELFYYALSSPAVDGFPATTRAKFLSLYRDMIRLTEAAFLIEQRGLQDNAAECKPPN